MSVGLRKGSVTSRHHQDLWACHKIQYSLKQRMWFQTLHVTYPPRFMFWSNLHFPLQHCGSDPTQQFFCLLLGEHSDCPIYTLKMDINKGKIQTLNDTLLEKKHNVMLETLQTGIKTTLLAYLGYTRLHSQCSLSAIRPMAISAAPSVTPAELISQAMLGTVLSATEAILCFSPHSMPTTTNCGCILHPRNGPAAVAEVT